MDADPELPSYEASQLAHPPSYRIVRVAIKASDLEDLPPAAASDGSASTQRNPIPSTKTGLKGKYARSKPEHAFRIVEMSGTDYEAYWKKDVDGGYVATVVEPPEGRREWLRKQLEMNEAWRRDIRSVDRDFPVLCGSRRDKVVAGAAYAAVLTACVATGPLAIGAMWGWDKFKQKRSRHRAVVE